MLATLTRPVDATLAVSARRRASERKTSMHAPLCAPRRFAILLVTLLLLTAGCGGDDAPGRPLPPGGAAGDGLDPPALLNLPPFSLTDQDGNAFGTDELLGKVWVADFIFTRCAGICPMLTSQMRKLQDELSQDPGWQDVRLVSFSVEPEYDDPQVLTDYAAQHGADPAHWRFLTGTREQIWGLSRNGFKLPVEENTREDADVPIIHSQQLVLVDRAGRVRGLYDGLEDASRVDLRRDAAKVLAEPLAVGVPAEIMNPPWLDWRREKQLAAAAGYAPFHDFGFTDRRFESGITFVHSCVGDLKENFKETHYDHGNGVAVADVDGDGKLDLYFTTQLGRNELWRNEGGGRFRDITDRAGVGLPDRISVAPAFGDIDNDGDPDLFVTTVRDGNVLFVNDGSGVFTDISSAAGVDHVGHSSGSTFLDYDGDGLLDLFVTNVGRYTTNELTDDGYYVSFLVTFDGHLKPERFENSMLYRNLGENRFEDVTSDARVLEAGWNGDPHPTDFNGDGKPDLYLINMQGYDSYFENRGDGTFARQPREMFPRAPFGSMGISIFDWNNDGLLDVYIVDMHTDMFSPTMFRRFIPDMEKKKLPQEENQPVSYLKTDGNHVLGNAFYQNEGGGTFREISDEIGAENYWPWGLSSGDLNADGYQDVFIASSMNYPFRYQINSLLLNDAGRRFLDSEFVLGVEPRRDRRTAKPWFRLDCSGADREHRDCRDRTGKIEVWGALGSRSSVIFDLEGDGDQDIVTLDFNSEPMVLVSDLSGKREVHWIEVALEGTVSNRSGIGARVTVHAGGDRYTRLNDGKTGYLAQSDLPLYFALDEATAVDRIEVLWPTGETQVVEGPLEIDRRIEIREGG
jgi:cytochrome oxidase Cu insertion factor (SCO1/SenC/PrrC family)